MALNLTPKELQMVVKILHEHVPEYEVWAFGSRVNGSFKPHSDLDLAVFTDRPLPPGRLAKLTDAFVESDLPFTVDIVDWATVDPTFQKIIVDRHEVVSTMDSKR